MSDYYAQTAEFAVEAAEENDDKLATQYRWFSLSLALLVLDFGAWIIVLGTN